MCKMIVGLGNPEERFKLNRHNIGFIMIDALVDYYKAQPCYLRTPRKPLMQISYDSKNDVIYLKPQDWMNSSGRSVGRVARELGIDSIDIMVIHDDMDFDFGRIKIKGGGSSGRHNGIQSIIDAVGKSFCRFRVGIDRPTEGETARDHVLSDFSLYERKQFCELIGLGTQVVTTFAAHGVQQTMSVFNRREVNDGRNNEEA